MPIVAALAVVTLTLIGLLTVIAWMLDAVDPPRDPLLEARLEALGAAYRVDLAAWEAERQMYQVALDGQEVEEQ